MAGPERVSQLGLPCRRRHSGRHPEKPGYAFFNDFNVLRSYSLAPSTANPNYTKIQARIRHIEFPGMPFNEPMLPEEDIVKIETWIKEGALEN